MLPQGGGGEFDEDVVDGGNDGKVRFFAHGFELLAEGEDLGGIATSGDGDGDGGLPAVHEPCGNDAPHLRERNLPHPGGWDGSCRGKDIALADTSAFAGRCERGELNAVRLGGATCSGARGGLSAGFCRQENGSRRMNEFILSRLGRLAQLSGLDLRLIGNRCALAFGEQVAKHMADFDDVAWPWAVGGDVQDAAIDGFDLLRGFVAFEREERFAFFDEVTILLQPREELAFLHGPAEPG